jgi:predicted SAM-dependent methyltransferase
MIQINKQPGQRILELGGGSNRHPSTDVNVDVRQVQGVDFVVNFEEPNWPISNSEFDAVLCIFVLEHISWRNVPNFLKEVHRVVKPKGKVIFVTPNTESQLKYIQENPDGWGGDNPFVSASKILLGDQDYQENAHRSFFSPVIAVNLLSEAGFENILVHPYGQLNTDMVVEASKIAQDESTSPETGSESNSLPGSNTSDPGRQGMQGNGVLSPVYAGPNKKELTSEQRACLFGRDYFDGGARHGGYRGFYWDQPSNIVLAQKVLQRKPESVLELGCGRGYVLKRLEDVGIRCEGMDFSRHCHLTRVCDGVVSWDILRTPWDSLIPVKCFDIDLCFSFSFLEYIPEEFLPQVFSEMQRTSKRGLHGINFGDRDDGFDTLVCTKRDRNWWYERLPEGHEVFSVWDLVDGQIPREVLVGDGKVKINAGSFMTMAHFGWDNLDQHDLSQFANANGYKFQQVDVRKGLPYDTGTVDLIFASHMIEHLTYRECLSFLRDCRRVLKPTGAMRLVTPDAHKLTSLYCGGGPGVLDYDPYPGETLSEFEEVNGGCANAPTPAGKLWALLHEGHASCFDGETLSHYLRESGFTPVPAEFRKTKCEAVKQILRETVEMGYGFSLFMDAIPLLEGEGS